jgi:hypothetical protein
MVPFAVEEVREASATDVNEFVEDCGNHSAVVNLEVKASVCTETHELFQDEASASLENGVYYTENETGVGFALMLTKQYGVLDVEMTLVVVKVDILGKQEGPNYLTANLAHEGKVGRVGVNGGFVNLVIASMFVIGCLEKSLDTYQIFWSRPGDMQVLLIKRITMHDIENVGERILGLLWYEVKFLEKTILCHSVGLSHYQIVTIREAIEGMLKEVL